MWQDLIKTINTQHTEIWQALIQHIELSLVSLLIAAIIAIPLAVVLIRNKRLAEIVLQITSIMQTIPSLALLGILIPFVGIGTVPSIIALVIYAIMPIFQGTYSGLSEIDPSLKEAELALGLPKWMTLFKIDLPLAMPSIIGGIRVALVLIIGTGTLAALIGAGGLGTYIITGIETNNNSYLIIGVILSSILAITFSALVKWIGSFSQKKIIITFLGLLAIFSGYFGYQKLIGPKNEIVIAGKLGSEPDILINMYKELIERDNQNLKVTLKPNFGATTFLFNSLKSNQIQVYPEFTGTITQTILKNDTNSTDHSAKLTYQLAKQGLKKQYDMDYLQPMKYYNGYALLVTKQFAKEYNLKTISDLLPIANKLQAGFDPDFNSLKDGYPGIKKSYHLNMGSIKTMEPVIRYKAIEKGKVNIIDGYTTDPEIKEYDLVALKDDKNFFPPFQGAPLLKSSTLKNYPSIRKSLEKLSNRISNTDMQEMNYQVQIKHKKASKVAHNYLKQHKII